MASELKHVYCSRLGVRDCYRIGRTKLPPEKRMSGYATGSSEKFTLYRVIKTEHPASLETYVHKLLDARRTENGDFFKVTAQELDEAVDQAIRFVEESQPRILQADKLRRRKPNNTVVDASVEMREIYRQLRILTREKYFIEQRIASLASKIQVVIGENSGMKGVASWEWAERWTIDKERFEKEQPKLYDEYKRDSGSRKFLLARFDLTIGD